MARPGTKKLIGLVLLLVVVAVSINVIAGLVETDQWAVEAAEAACRERGLELDEVDGMKSDVRSTLIGRTAEIQFRGRRQNRLATIHVTLRKPLFFLGWQVADVREEVGN
jgi:hypothetical protein